MNNFDYVYIACGHRLLLWKYSSNKNWYIYDSIIGDIRKVCFVQYLHDIDSPYSFGFVIATSSQIHLIGVIISGDNDENVRNEFYVN